MDRGTTTEPGPRIEPADPGGRKAISALFGIDTRALAAVRVGLAAIILTGAAIEPPSLSAGSLVGLAGIILVPAAVALLIGYRTRPATILTWLAYGLPLREAFLQPGGTVHLGNYCLVLALFWCMFLPLGEHLSLDSKGERRSPARYLSVASGGLLLQMFLIYFWAGVTKDLQEWLFDATALHTVLSNPEHGTALGVGLTTFPAVLAVASVATVMLEVFGAVLLFFPLRGLETRRALLAPIFILFHAGMAVYMTLQFFPYVMMVLWLVFLPPRVWDRVVRRTSPTEIVIDRSRLRLGLATTALAYVWTSSIVTWFFYPATEGLPGIIQDVGRNLLLYQQWAMFSLPSSL